MADARLKALVLLSSTAAVDLNVTTKTALYTVPTGKSCIVTHEVIRLASASATTASFGSGFNANADDVIAAETYTELTGATLVTIRHAKDGAIRGAAGDVLGCKCATPEGSALTITVDVFGYLY